MKILITAFDAFDGQDINPSKLVLERLPDKVYENQIYKLLLPTVFKKSANKVEEKIKNIRPNIIISLGQAGRRSEISVERVAINIDDASICDNDGNKPIDEIIRKDGKNAYFSNLPVKAIVKNLRKNKIPSSLSNTAGSFVCNHIMYNDLYFADKYKNIRAGFIHLPFLPQQVIGKGNIASMSLDMMVDAIIIAIKTSIDFEKTEDLKEAYGKTH